MEFKHISANMSSSPPPSKLLNIFWKARKLRKPNRAKVWTIPNSLTKKLKTKKQTCWLGLFFKEHHVYLWEYIGRGTKCEQQLIILYVLCPSGWCGRWPGWTWTCGWASTPGESIAESSASGSGSLTSGPMMSRWQTTWRAQAFPGNLVSSCT